MFLRIIVILAAFVLVSLLGTAAVDWWTCLPEGTSARYVGRQSCVQCHARQVEDWTGSDHDLAMDLATPETVLGDFDDAELDHFGLTSRMFRRGEDFYITTDGPEGNAETFRIQYTFGVRPLQQYMVEFDDGRVQVLPIAWDIEGERWFHIYPDEQIAHDDLLHWTGSAQNWNYMCAECHSTNVERNYDLSSDRYHTTHSEIDVSCETCHGPGSMHVELAEATSLFWDRRYGYGLVPLKSEDARIEIETCAPCHSRRRGVHPDFQPGKPFLDHYAPVLLDQDVYHVDGQIDDEVYVYGSFLQSRMYREGVRCTDCHQPHTAKLKAQGNQLCGQCHTPAKYDNLTHHHHPLGSSGARCVECHMPEKTYMVVDPRRDHSLRIPRPDLSVTLGTPNACTTCHQDESVEWARDAFLRWYGQPEGRQSHYAHAIAAGRNGDAGGDKKLALLLRRDNVGPVVRASAAALLGQYTTNASREALEGALEDPEAMVRASAVRALDGRGADELRRLLVPLLDDPVRWPRLEAVRLLSEVPRGRLRDDVRTQFDAALAEYKRGQEANADQPAAHLNLAVLYENLRQVDKAEATYKTALGLDERFTPARNNLAMLYDRLGRKEEAQQQLRQAIRHEPGSAQSHYSLGLLLAEKPESLEEATRTLAEAARLGPERARIRYNYGLALQRLGLGDAAERELLAAQRLQPDDADVAHALVILYAQKQDWERAVRQARRLVRIRPGDRNARGLLEQLLLRDRQPATLGPAPR